MVVVAVRMRRWCRQGNSKGTMAWRQTGIGKQGQCKDDVAKEVTGEKENG
jgi:hypothetical protein